MYKKIIERLFKRKKTILTVIALFIAASVFIFPKLQGDFAGWAWKIFIVTMMIRPVFELVQRFPLLWPRIWRRIEKVDQAISELILQVRFIAKVSQKFGIKGIWDLIKKLLFLVMQWRREFGILAAVFGLAHGAGILLIRKNKELMDVFNPALWDFTSLWGWGLLSAALMLPLLATSNIWSMKFFKKWWKPLQRLSYIAFIAAGIHVFLAEKEAGPLIILVIWGTLWCVVIFKKVSAPQEENSTNS